MDPPNCCDALAWARVMTAMPVTAVVALVTWFATYRLTKRSERRKELLSKIDKLYGQVDEIHKLAYQYHTSETEDKNLASEIHVKITIFSGELKIANLFAIDQMARLLIGLRRAVTLENFETRDFNSKRPNDPLLKRIDAACEKLKISIDESRHT